MSTPRRRSLSRDRIVDAAMSLADRHGLAGLSMRQVAAALRCEVMSLYNHVANKDDLLDGMLDRVYADIADPSDGVHWRAAVRDLAVAAHEALVGHPWASELVTSRLPGPARRRHAEHLLRVLADAALPEDVADLGFHAIMIHVQGFTHQQVGYEQMMRSGRARPDRRLGDVDAEEFPFFAAHLRYHEQQGHRADDFGFVLDLILDGLERAARPTARPAARSTTRRRAGRSSGA
ncbi:MAG: TetR/AcrR family transcriptional regulator C-terminal domain-containing protein [Actinobacteria bacterium]|nr:TetR/AcrR family transcriptional regulator C-terminal domain-containing protein [Actinomycetota bacterium]